jgi:hypothetical protein
MKLVRLSTAAVLIAGLAIPALGQVEFDLAQRKALSIRAAKADAYRKLAEAIRGLQINSDTYVKDFVAESDTIQANMDAFIKGVRLGQPRCFEDLSCEVPAEVTVQKVIETLKQIHQRHYKGSRIKGSDFEQINRQVERNIIKVVGTGAPREDLPPDLPEGVVEELGGPPIPMEPSRPPIWDLIPPRARLMAERAAEVDAKRQLLERIKGLRVTSDTTVRDFVAESDQITAQAMGTVVGATVVRKFYHHDEPIVEVTVEVPTETVIRCIKEIHTRSIQGDHVRGSDISELTTSIRNQTFQATGMGVPRPEFLRAYNAKLAPEAQLPPWAGQPIVATGSCPEPENKAGTAQGKLLAARCAELDAKRRLAEQIQGLRLSSNTTVKDFVTQHDEIRTQVDAVLVNSRVERTEFDGEVATVTVSIPGMAVWGILNDVRTVAGPEAAGAANPPPPPAGER